MNTEFRVMIVDDNAHAREGIRTILEADPSFFIIIGEAASGEEAIQLFERWMPDLILMDINMPGMDGLETTREIKERYPYVKIVMVTVSDDITHLFEALKKGAQGYLMKNLNASSWIEYLRAVCLDEAPMSKELASRLLREFTSKDDRDHVNDQLTAREQEVLNWVARGNTNKEIANTLYISENTVKNHLKNILHKLHLDNRVQLTRYVLENKMD